MIMVFDLDDTLYDEKTFVKSGYRAVAKYLEDKYGLKKEIFYSQMLTELKKTRVKVFDKILDKHGLLSKKLVHRCLMIYRKHKPKLVLYPDAKDFLRKYKNTPKYIVTDGNILVQKNKINALRLNKYIKRSFLTWKKGKKFSKPSTYFIDLIAKKEKVKPGELIFVGDNPEKDFVGIKPLGYQTVRILRGAYKNLTKPIEYEAETVISSFSCLKNKLNIKET